MRLLYDRRLWLDKVGLGFKKWGCCTMMSSSAGARTASEVHLESIQCNS